MSAFAGRASSEASLRRASRANRASDICHTESQHPSDPAHFRAPPVVGAPRFERGTPCL